MKLIGLTGYKQSGKDTFADVLINEGGFTRLAFADALKDEVGHWLGITRAQVNAEKADLRRTLQLRGTFRRGSDPDYWIKILYARIVGMQHGANYGDAPLRIVVTDLRFPNEADMIRQRGGRILRMRRADQPKVTKDKHVSETGVDLIKYDAEISCGSIAQRQEAAREFLRSLKGV